jgi:hypothetical protein
MYARAKYAAYLAAVREQVCAQCPQRQPDRPPFTAVCRRCGVELQLPRIVESIRDRALPEVGPTPPRGLVCARCDCLGGGNCPCAVAPLADRVVRAVRTVDERREQWDHLQRWLAAQPRRPRPPAVALVRAYEVRTGTYVGCD